MRFNITYQNLFYFFPVLIWIIIKSDILVK